MRILFVDDEPKVLEALGRMLRPMRHQWEMSFCASGLEALRTLEQWPFQAVVSDIRMPKMTGVELLQEVRRRWPGVMRVVLSGQASRETVLRCVGPTHQYLSKPCDGETLKSVLSRLGRMRQTLQDQSLRELVCAIESLPSLPALHEELTRELLSENASVSGVAAAVARDVSMVARVLHLVGTGFFGAPRAVADASEAVAVLGVEILKPLLAEIGVFSSFQRAAVPLAAMEDLWSHSAAVASCAKLIAQIEGADARLAQASFQAGMLHDLGKAILAESLGDEYAAILASAESRKLPLHEVETNALGASHAEVGAYLLGIWGMDDKLVQAVAHHHCPNSVVPDERTIVLAAVHAADVIAGGRTALSASDAGDIDCNYLEGVAAKDRPPMWRQACQDFLQPETTHA